MYPFTMLGRSDASGLGLLFCFPPFSLSLSNSGDQMIMQGKIVQNNSSMFHIYSKGVAMLRKLVFMLLVVCAVATITDASFAQCSLATARTWIAIRDNGLGRDTLWFGQDVAGSRGLDNPPLCEIELPPPPPTGVFDVRFVNPPGREGLDTPAGMGQGFKHDYRQYYDPLDVDTFKLKFQPSDAGFPFLFKWTTAGILGVSDSAWLRDEFGGFIFNVRMHVVDSLLLSNPAFSSALIIRFGATATGVKPINNLVPQQYSLEQNYPNPFNPSTTIEFAVSRLSKTDVAVFDILGKKVATLVSEQLAPGHYRVEWNGTNELGSLVSSGVYMLRMNAVDEKNQAFSAVRKLMFTK